MAPQQDVAAGDAGARSGIPRSVDDWTMALLALALPTSQFGGQMRVTPFELTVVLVLGVAVIRARRPTWRWLLLAWLYTMTAGLTAIREVVGSSFDVAVAAQLGGPIVGACAAYLIIVSATDERGSLRWLVLSWCIASCATAVWALLELNNSVRATAGFRFPNELATYGFATVAVAYGAWRIRLASPILAGILSASGAIAVVASGGRAGIGAVLVLAGHAGVRSLGKPGSTGRVGAALVAVLALSSLVSGFGSYILERAGAELGLPTSRVVAAVEDPSEVIDFYSENWGNGVQLVVESPIVGKGISESYVRSDVLGGDGFEIHNTPLLLATQFGVIGFVMIAYGIAATLGAYRPYSWDVFGPMMSGLLFLSLFHGLLQSRSTWVLIGVAVVVGSVVDTAPLKRVAKTT